MLRTTWIRTRNMQDQLSERSQPGQKLRQTAESSYRLEVTFWKGRFSIDACSGRRLADCRDSVWHTEGAGSVSSDDG